MLVLAKIVSTILALVVFGILRVVTADMGTAAWAVSLIAAIVFYFILRAILVSPLLRAATKKASTQILEHFAGGGDMSGAVSIAGRLGLSAKDAREVAESHRGALVKAVIERITQEAVERYRKDRDREKLKSYLREQNLSDDAIEKVVEEAIRKCD